MDEKLKFVKNDESEEICAETLEELSNGRGEDDDNE